MAEEQDAFQGQFLGRYEAWLRRVVAMVDHVAGNAVMRLGDGIGAKRFALRNSSDVEVFGVDSLGRWVAVGTPVHIKDAGMICHFDGAKPYGTDTTGSANGHKGQVGTVAAGSAVYVAGLFGKALQTASTLNITWPTANAISASAGSISMWINPAFDGNDTTNIDLLFSGSAYYAAGTIRLNRSPVQDGNNIRAMVVDNSAGFHYVDCVTPTSGFKSVWNHIVMTWDATAGRVRLYLNNKRVGQWSGAAWTPGPLDSLLQLKKNYGGSHVLDDLLCMDRELSAEEVDQIYRSNAPVYSIS